MAEKYIPKTDKEKIDYLMATDERRENHIREIQKDIKGLADNVSELITVIAGSKYNKKTGFVDLVDELGKKVDNLKTEVKSLNEFKSTMQPQFNIGKWVFILFITAIIINYVNEKTTVRYNKQITETTK